MQSERYTPFCLVAMIPLFLFPVMGPFIDQQLWDFGDPLNIRIPLSYLMWNTALTGCISLCGGIVFLAITRESNQVWYLGIPLVLAFAFIAFSPALLAVFPLRDPSPAFYNPLYLTGLVSAYGTFLLPPVSALFFWSQKELGKWAVVLTVIALLLTLNTVAFWFAFFSHYLVSAGVLTPPPPQYVDGHSVKSDGEGLLFLFIHIMIGLPLLGSCFLTLAGYTWYSARNAAPVPLPEVRP